MKKSLETAFKCWWSTKTSTGGQQMRLVARRRIWPLFRMLMLIGMGYIILYPLLYMMSMGFRSVNDLYDQTVKWVPKHFTIDNFSRIINGMEYLNVLKNTLFVSLGSSLILLLPGSMIAYSLSRFKYHGQNLIFILVLITIIVPLEFFALPSYLNFSHFDGFGLFTLYNAITGSSFSLNISDSVLTFFLPALFGIGIRSGLYIYIMRQFFKGLPHELEEAACIDGCGFINTFIKIIIPNAIPAFVTVFLFSFVWHWNDYQLSSVFMPKNRMLSAVLANLSNILYEVDAMTGTVAIDNKQIVVDRQIASLLVVTPVIMLYLSLQHFFTESIERTGLVE